MLFLFAADPSSGPCRMNVQPFQPSTVLTMDHAIALAIQNNLNTKLAAANTEETRGHVLEAAADLLPHIIGTDVAIPLFQNQSCRGRI